MDAFTAGSVLIVSKFGVAVIMTAIYCLIPRERCALHWALAAALVACGAMVSMANAGAPRYAVLVAGNGAIILGMIMQWHGVRTFYKKNGGYLGWLIGIVFLSVYLYQIATDAPVANRAILVSASILGMLLLNAYEFSAGHRARRSIGSAMALVCSTFLVVCYVVNVGLSWSGLMQFSHATTSPLTIALIYLLPAVGSMALTVSLVTLLFERSRKELGAQDDPVTLTRHPVL